MDIFFQTTNLPFTYTPLPSKHTHFPYNTQPHTAAHQPVPHTLLPNTQPGPLASTLDKHNTVRQLTPFPFPHTTNTASQQFQRSAKRVTAIRRRVYTHNATTWHWQHNLSVHTTGYNAACYCAAVFCLSTNQPNLQSFTSSTRDYTHNTYHQIYQPPNDVTTKELTNQPRNWTIQPIHQPVNLTKYPANTLPIILSVLGIANQAHIYTYFSLFHLTLSYGDKTNFTSSSAIYFTPIYLHNRLTFPSFPLFCPSFTSQPKKKEEEKGKVKIQPLHEHFTSRLITLNLQRSTDSAK